MQGAVIGAMSTMIVIELFLVLYYYQKASSILTELQKKKLESENLNALVHGLETRIDAEKKTAEERRVLINNLINAAGNGTRYKGQG